MIGSKGIIIEIKAHEARGILYSSFFGKVSIERMESSPVKDGKTASALERLLSAFPSDATITLQLPGHLFMVRKISLPFTDRKKIRKTLPYELDGFLPFPIDELLIDSVVSTPPEKGSSVMAVAIPKKTVSDYLGLFPEGRKPVRVVPDFISLLSLGMNIGHEYGTYGVLNAGDSASSIVLISGGRPTTMRSHAGSEGASIADWVTSTIKPLQDNGQKIERLYVAGVGAIHELPLLGKLAQAIPLPKAVKGINDDKWPLLAGIAGGGLASIEYPSFNVLGSGSESERVEKALKVATIGTAILLILGTADLYLRYRTASQSFSVLKAESKRIFLSVMPQVKKVVKEDAQIKDALKREREISEALIGKPSPSYLAALKGLEKVIGEHKEIKIRETVYEGGSLTIEGDGNGVNAEGLKKLFFGMEGTKEARVEEMVQGVEPNSYRFRVKVELKP